MRKLSLYLLVCIFISTFFLVGVSHSTEFVGSPEEIIGAFGMKLGDVLNPSFVPTNSLTDGTPMYNFKPKKCFRGFNNYYVMITPKTRKIYKIWADCSVEFVTADYRGYEISNSSNRLEWLEKNFDLSKNNKNIGEKEQDVIISILEGKYGKREKEGLFDGIMSTKRIIDQGNRYIYVRVSGIMDYNINIVYTDRILSKIAEQERIEIEIQNTDTDCL